MGLDYLTLDRQARTLSGGETQRIHLAASLGSGLTSTLYVLDEPTIGLHARDSERLLDLLRDLAARGNTVLVVEHERKLIEGADHVIDLGPEAGENGGELLMEGTVDGAAGGASARSRPATSGVRRATRALGGTWRGIVGRPVDARSRSSWRIVRGSAFAALGSTTSRDSTSSSRSPRSSE